VTDEQARAIEGERRQLTAQAYRMLGTLADAEDAVQEALVRWYRLSESDREAIAVPGAWLTRTLGRICLDVLGSARVRREQYVGEWLPEPLPERSHLAVTRSADPLDRVELDDTVSTALLIVLESLTPAERVAFVLHDVFGVGFTEIAAVLDRSVAASRQLATSARRHIQDRRAGAASRERHDTLVRAFTAACATGDLRAVIAVLDPDVVLRSDGGGVVSAARRPVLGAENVARFLLGLARKHPDASFDLAVTGDGLALVARIGGGLHSVWGFGVRGDRVADVWIVANPSKLTEWR
jgi:RNA polymerase sigma-70 factor (ECF subfamily)